MPRALKFILYPIMFLFFFAIFLYWSFPYEALKDRVIGTVEQQLGGKYEVSAGKMSPYWFTGIEMKDIEIKAAGQKSEAAVKVSSAYGRVSIFSLIFGAPHVSFTLVFPKGELEGAVKVANETLGFNIYFDDFNLSNLKFLFQSSGLAMRGKVNGKIDMQIDRLNTVRSEGKVLLDLSDVAIEQSNVKLGEMEMPMPETILTEKKGSRIELDIGKGAIAVNSFKFTGGDLQMGLTGKIFLAANKENYRFNLSGTFSASEKLEKALPFMFVVEKQKAMDGTYPISIAGRLAKPMIKIGTFTLPM